MRAMRNARASREILCLLSVADDNWNPSDSKVLCIFLKQLNSNSKWEHYRNGTFLKSFPKCWPQLRPADQKLLVSEHVGLQCSMLSVRIGVGSETLSNRLAKGNALIIIDSRFFFVRVLKFLEILPRTCRLLKGVALKNASSWSPLLYCLCIQVEWEVS